MHIDVYERERICAAFDPVDVHIGQTRTKHFPTSSANTTNKIQGVRPAVGACRAVL